MTTGGGGKRYIAMSVPKNDDDGAFWFVFDMATRRSVEEVTDFGTANRRARELNAEQKGARDV